MSRMADDSFDGDDAFGLSDYGAELVYTPRVLEHRKRRRSMADRHRETLSAPANELSAVAFGLSPLPFRSEILKPGRSAMLQEQPQLTMGGPYRLQVSPSSLRLLDLHIGNCSCSLAPGYVRAGNLVIGPGVAPANLMPFRGEVCTVGMVVRVALENPTNEDVEAEVTLWGRTAEAAFELQLSRDSGLPVCSVCLGVGGHVFGCAVLGELELERELPPAVFERVRELLRARGELGAPAVVGAELSAELRDFRARRDADRVASAEYVERNPLPVRPAEQQELEWWQEQWSTATDES